MSAPAAVSGSSPNKEPDDDTKEEMEEERERRLDPDNRPDGAEVDNTDRTFDHERGQFTDSEDYDESEPAPFSDPENPNNSETSDERRQRRHDDRTTRTTTQDDDRTSDERRGRGRGADGED